MLFTYFQSPSSHKTISFSLLAIFVIVQISHNMSDSLSLHFADSSVDPKPRATAKENDFKKKTPTKAKRTLNSFIPENVQEDLKKGEAILNKTERDFSVNESSTLFSDAKVSELDELLAPPLLKNLSQFMGIEKLTRIQEKSLKPFMTEKDLYVLRIID
jgi:hypothetical protein